MIRSRKRVGPVEGKKGCFPGYVMVETPKGPVRIDKIKEGQEVVCFDEKGDLHTGKVSKVLSHPKEDILRIHYWGGSLDTTVNHWVLNQYNTFALAGSLTKDDSLVNADGHLIPVKKLETFTEVPVFNLHVEPHATFIADGVRVHNGGLGVGNLREHLEGDKGGGKGGGGNGYVPQEAPNTLRSKSLARVLDVISEGEIGGLVDGDKSIFFNDTPLQSADGTYNFSGVNVYTRNGTPDQAYVAGFPAVETEVSVGVQVEQATPVVRTITDADATHIVVKIRLPGLTKQSTNGDLNGASVNFLIERQSDGGGYTTMRDETISGKTTSAYEEQYRIPLDEGGHPWDIRVTRVTADSDDDATLNDDLYWSTYTKIIDNKLTYADTAVVGIEIDAEQFAEQVPSRAYEIYGIKVQIPSNYDPVTRAYTGLWDGSFTTAWTNNPAWILYDVLVNTRYGIGESIDASQIDKFALYEIAQYCDELVPDGAGGTEPRFTFNGLINTREEAYKVLNSIASTFRGMLYWSSGLVTASMDKPGDAAKLITNANVLGGEFNYTGPSLKTRHSVAIVRYNDPDDGYNTAVVAYEDPELIQQVGWKAKEIQAYGCTSKGQAFRQGRWALDTERYSTEVVTYRASFDNADLTPGEIVDIMDSSYAGVRNGGRLKGTSTTTTLALDGSVTLSVGETYTIACVLPNGSIEERTITDTSDGSSYTSVNLDSALSDTPNAGAMWVMTGSDVAPRPFRVVSITEVEKNIYEVSALFHDETKYARVEEDIDLTPASFTALPTGKLTAPSDITATEYLYLASNGVVASAVTLSFTASADPRASFHQVEMIKPDTDFWQTLPVQTGVSQDIYDISPGLYQFRVRALDSFGNFSDWFTESINLLGVTAPPSDVTNFRVNNVGPQSNLSWSGVPDLDLAYYVIKYSTATSNAKWGEATILATKIPAGTEYYTVPTLIGTYLIKAVDKSDSESTNATTVISNIGDINQVNVIETLTEDSSFAGTKTNTEVDTNTLVLTDYSSIGYYYFDNDLDLGEVFTSRVVPSVSAVGSLASNTIDEWDPLEDVEFMSTADPSNWAVTVQIRTTDDDPTGSPTWTDWGDIIIGDYTCRAFEFRVILESYDGATTPAISALSVKIDMPDRIEGVNDVTTNGSGESIITYSTPFKASPRVKINAEDMQTGDYFTVTSKTVSGFTVNFYDSTDTGVQRTFDWEATGYGRQQ